jgi:hypothetical protein
MKKMKFNLFKIASIIFISLILNSCTKLGDSLSPKVASIKYFNAEFNGLSFKSKDPASALEALQNFNQSFSYKGIAGNFINVPGKFNARINEKGEHWYDQRFFIKNGLDTLMVDVGIEFPIISGESQVFTKKSYDLGLFLRDPTIDIPNVLSAKVWAGKCPTPENPQPSLSVTVFGKRKTDGNFGVIKYWQTVKSVPHNDVGSISIDEIDTVNKTLKGKFKSTISSQYINLTLDQYNKMTDPICKPEVYKVDKSTISGEFFVEYK